MSSHCRCQVCRRIRKLQKTYRMVGSVQAFIESSLECSECVMLTDEERNKRRDYFYTMNLVCGICGEFPCKFDRKEDDEACERFDYKQEIVDKESSGD